jgi:hypothetical protein
VLGGIILSGTAGADVPSPHNFLEIILGLGPEYNSDVAGDLSPPQCSRLLI